MRSALGGGRVGTRLVYLIPVGLLGACEHPFGSRSLQAAPTKIAQTETAAPMVSVEVAPTWPPVMAAAFSGRGGPHAQPMALPRDSRGWARWLAFVGTREVALGAWRVSVSDDGATEIQPVEHWPAGVRVIGGLVDGSVAYVLLESVAVLDQPSGLRGTWIDTGGPASPFDASPMALADMHDMSELAARVKQPPPIERETGALLATLRSASTSTTALANVLPREGADLHIAWQSLFTQRVGHLDANGAASSPLASALLAVLQEALATQACGADACEAWTDSGRAVVRFSKQDSRWVVRTVIEDAPVRRASASGTPPHVVPSTMDTTDTAFVLHERTRDVRSLLGQAALGPGSATIGVGLTDFAPETPLVVVREGNAARVFPIDAGGIRVESGEPRWDVAFADLDGDGRTDVVMRMSGAGAGGLPISWTQAFVAPPPSVQASSLDADLPSAFSLFDSMDVVSATRAAASIPLRGVSHDDACRLLAAANTPAGFRRQAAPDARLLHFDQPGMPTWRPKVIPLAKLAADDVRGIGAHCMDLACSATRPYCAWRGGSQSEHFWFGWRDGRLEILGAADYDGE